MVEQHTGLDAASWGGNLSIGAQVRGVAGVIVDGPVRDIDDSRKLDFPVFARDHTARTARGRIVEVATGEPIDVGDVTVSPGDYAVADGSAAVFVAQAEIERVLEAAEAIVAREEAMAQALREGKPISQVMGANYEHMLKKSSHMSQRRKHSAGVQARHHRAERRDGPAWASAGSAWGSSRWIQLSA